MQIVHSITQNDLRPDQGHSYLRCCLHSINFIFISRAYYFVNCILKYRKLDILKGRFIKGNIKGNKDTIIRHVLLIVLLIGPGGLRTGLSYIKETRLFGEL